MAINWNDVVFTIENTVIDVAPSDVMLLVSGVPGESATIDGVSAETLPAGSEATVENTGTNRNAVFKFGIPKGDKGEPVWGDIEGDIADQTDLAEALDSKSDPVTKSASGSMVTLTDATDAPVSDMVVAIEPVQEGSGDPSPDNVRAITGWDTCNVAVAKKNLLPKPSPSSTTINGITWTVNSDGTIRCQGTATARSIFYYLPNKDLGYGYLKPGTYLSSSGITTDMTSGLKVNGLWSGLNNNLLTVMSGPIQQVWFSVNTLNEAVDITLYPQIELGNQATAYEPYNGQTVTIDLGGTRYGGTLDMTTGVLTVDRAMVLLGDLNWAMEDPVNVGQLYRFRSSGIANSVNPDVISSVSQYVVDAKCSKYFLSSNPVYGRTENGSFCIATTNKFIYVIDNSCNSAEAFKTANSGTQLVYPLATPQTIQLTPAEVRTILGECHVWADTGDVLELTYRADTKTYIDNAVADSQRSVQTMITSNIETTTTASKSYSAGNLIILNGQLLRATTGIGIGGTITIGSNAEVITLETIIAELSA